jgi:hypothetical protein
MSVRPEIVLLAGAAGIGLLALLFPLLLRQNERRPPLSRPRLVTALGVILLLFGLTRLRNYPFAPGGTLGDGLAIGGAVGLITVFLASLWPGVAAAGVGASGGALLGTILILWAYRGYPNAALAGFAAGHAVATLLAVGGEEEGSARAGLWVGPVVASLLAGAVLLAIARADDMRPAERLALDGKVWWVWPAAVLAIALAGQMVALTVFVRRAGSHLASGIVAGLLLFLLWLRFPRYASLMAPLAAGFVTALLMLVGYSGIQVFRYSGPDDVRPEDLNARTPEYLNTLPAFLAPALVLLLLATAYRLYAGYGIAMAALGAAVLLPWLAEREPRAVGRALFSLLAAAVLFRVYYNSYDLRDNDIPLTAHYALIGLLAGALTTFALGAYQWSVERRAERSDSVSSATSRLAPAVFALLAAAALPCLLALFWGQKAGGGLLLGLVIGHSYRMMTALMDAGTNGATAAIAARVPEAALLLTGWVTVQLLNQVSTYGLQLLRVQRVGLIAALVAVCFLAILYRTWRNPDVRLG